MIEKVLQKFSIVQKINFSLYVSFIVMVVLIALPFTLINDVGRTYTQHIAAYEKVRQSIYVINENLRKASSLGIEIAIEKKTSLKPADIDRHFKIIQNELKKLKEDLLIGEDEETKTILKNLQNRVYGYRAITKSIQSEMQEDMEDGLYAILALSKASEKISKEFNILMEKIKHIHEQKVIEIQNNIAQTLQIKIALTMLILIIVFIFNKQVAKVIIDELEKLQILITSFFDVLNKKRTRTKHVKIEGSDEIAKMAQVIDENIYIAEELLQVERDRAKEIEIQVDLATKEIKKLNKELHSTQKEIIHVMGSIAEEHSKETGLHIKRVANYSFLLAKLAGLPLKEAMLLRDVSPMHDIGKLGIPDAILNKPGRFTEEEFEKMKEHTTIGYNMLKNSKRELLKTAAIVAYEHHERWDGKGYPRGLKGEEIHIFGRITAIVDVFDALASDRVYKPAWSLDKIIKLFEEEKGKQFDPYLTQIFLDNLDEFLKSKKAIEARG